MQNHSAKGSLWMQSLLPPCVYGGHSLPAPSYRHIHSLCVWHHQGPLHADQVQAVQVIKPGVVVPPSENIGLVTHHGHAVAGPGAGGLATALGRAGNLTVAPLFYPR